KFVNGASYTFFLPINKFSASSTHSCLDPVYWEDLPENEYGERRLNCHNYDPETKSRYRWRFNGSSILPKHTGTHKEELIFDKGSNAYRALFAGEYSCCIHESLGRACYTQRLLLRALDPPEEIGVDLTDSEVLYAKEGNSYNLRLAKSKLMEELRCNLNNHSTPENVIPLVTKRKTANHHLKIEHISADNVGEYNCTLRLYKKVQFLHITGLSHKEVLRRTWIRSTAFFCLQSSIDVFYRMYCFVDDLASIKKWVLP
ncbi:unnamed protein product, partial [Haemonchus placei]|uniref:Ig-like domain-containing protein n=1 Tax=Haemonchus placei TaxID=6290 RepID=A0A0N4WCF0_HAEPC